MLKLLIKGGVGDVVLSGPGGITITDDNVDGCCCFLSSSVRPKSTILIDVFLLFFLLLPLSISVLSSSSLPPKKGGMERSTRGLSLPLLRSSSRSTMP